MWSTGLERAQELMRNVGFSIIGCTLLFTNIMGDQRTVHQKVLCHRIKGSKVLQKVVRDNLCLIIKDIRDITICTTVQLTASERLSSAVSNGGMICQSRLHEITLGRS